MSKVYGIGAFAALFVLASSAHADLPDFTQLVEKNGPSVVNITATQGDGAAQKGDDADDQDDDGGPQQNMPPGMQDFLRRFFGPNGPNGGNITLVSGGNFIRFSLRTNSSNFPCISATGRIQSTIPVLIALAGMLSNSASFGSCAIVSPPCARICLSPITPSESAPDMITQTARCP